MILAHEVSTLSLKYQTQEEADAQWVHRIHARWVWEQILDEKITFHRIASRTDVNVDKMIRWRSCNEGSTLKKNR